MCSIIWQQWQWGVQVLDKRNSHVVGAFSRNTLLINLLGGVVNFIVLMSVYLLTQGQMDLQLIFVSVLGASVVVAGMSWMIQTEMLQMLLRRSDSLQSCCQQGSYLDEKRGWERFNQLIEYQLLVAKRNNTTNSFLKITPRDRQGAGSNILGRIKNNLRSIDICVSSGLDYLVFLPQTGDDGCNLLLKRMASSIKELRGNVVVRKITKAGHENFSLNELLDLSTDNVSECAYVTCYNGAVAE